VAVAVLVDSQEKGSSVSRSVERSTLNFLVRYSILFLIFEVLHKSYFTSVFAPRL